MKNNGTEEQHDKQTKRLCSVLTITCFNWKMNFHSVTVSSGCSPRSSVEHISVLFILIGIHCFLICLQVIALYVLIFQGKDFYMMFCCRNIQYNYQTRRRFLYSCLFLLFVNHSRVNLVTCVTFWVHIKRWALVWSIVKLRNHIG